jgi:hypothetical protein
LLGPLLQSIAICAPSLLLSYQLHRPTQLCSILLPCPGDKVEKKRSERRREGKQSAREGEREREGVNRGEIKGQQKE